MIEIEKLGNLIESQKYTINKDSKKIEQFIFNKNGYDNKYSNIKISSYRDPYSDMYFNTLLTVLKNGKEITTEFDSKTFYKYLSTFLGYIDFIEGNDKDICLDINTYNKDNSKIKSDNEYSVELDVNSKKFLINIPNNCVCIKDKNYYLIIDKETKKKYLEYTILNDTIFCKSLNEFNNLCFSFNEITSNDNTVSIELDNIDSSFEVLYKDIPNLSQRANTIFVNDKRIDIEYDNCLIQKQNSYAKSKFENYISNNDVIHSYISLHKVFYDLFDYNMNIAKDNLWSIDQIEVLPDSIIFGRYIYSIDNENELIKNIENSHDKEYVIPYQNIDDEDVI